MRKLKDEVNEGSSKMLELEKRLEADAASMEQLKNEILEGKRLADSAHTREQRAQEVIENLRVSVAKLNEEIVQKNKQLASEEQWVWTASTPEKRFFNEYIYDHQGAGEQATEGRLKGERAVDQRDGHAEAATEEAQQD